VATAQLDSNDDVFAAAQVVRDAADPAPAGALALTIKQAAAPLATVFSATPTLPTSAISSTSLSLTKAEAVTVAMTIGGAAVSGSGQAVSVLPAKVHAPSAQFSLASASLVAGNTLQMSALAKDQYGNALTAGGDLFQCAQHLPCALRIFSL
jgi:hypothetical protein